MADLRECPECGSEMRRNARSCSCGWGRTTTHGKPKPDRHRPETCAVCHQDGVTGRGLSPLRTEVDGVLQPLQWVHDACRRPTMPLARYCDRLARGEVHHADPAVEAMLRASRDPRASREDRRDLMSYLRDRIRAAGKPLPYDPAERLADAPATATRG